jgi:putative phosphoesterase
MRVGLISDTHDNLPKIEKAVKLFNQEKVDFVLHAGDFIAPFTIPILKKLQCDFCGVFGNNDGERAGLTKISEGKIKIDPQRLNLGNRSILLVHDLTKLDLEKIGAEIIIFGHTHKPEIKKLDGKLLINPGEACGWLTNKSTVALLDLVNLNNSLIDI